MAGDTGSHIRGVLDGDLADVTTPNREAQREVIEQIYQHVAQTQAAAHPSIWSAPDQPPGPAPTSAPGTGGGYQFDPGTISTQLKQWEQLLKDIRTDQLRLRDAWGAVEAPSGDTPAAKNADAIRDSIQAAIDQNRSMQQYAETWIDALSKANGTYVERDQKISEGLPGTDSATDGHAL